MGRLTREVELKQIPSGQPVANIGLAINHKFQTRDGDKREETTFVDCEAWGRTAEVMNQYLAKGRPVFIEGRLKLDTWQDQQGQNRSKMRVVVENFQFIDSRGGGGGGGGGAGAGAGAGESSHAPAQVGAGAPAPGQAPHQPITEDDIPF